MTADLVRRVRQLLATTDAELEDAVAVEADGIVDDAVLDALRTDVHAELVGAGPLEPLLASPGVTDVLVNGCDDVWIDRGCGLRRSVASFADDEAVVRLAQRLAAAAGRRLDDAQPYVDAALPDGTRLHAVLPPIVTRPSISLRVLGRERLDLDALVARASIARDVRTLLEQMVAARLALLITGGTGSGKTTLLGALLACVSNDERIVTIEDSAELVVEHPHVVQLLARAANIEGSGAVGMSELVRQSLRMRPDRIVVGEFRGAEIAELLVALNTGHEGGAATMHANSAADVPARCVALGALAGLRPDTTLRLLTCAVHVVVHMRRGATGRFVEEIALLSGDADDVCVDPVWTYVDGRGDAYARLEQLLARCPAGPVCAPC
ncbi:MAG TPA: TadA family conjugal transfer-associated ATPase [Jatrophihabitantaceae bacterium]|nr:TadA family conjugal transfer-associated ATPase [Jatrophihabitantaceae bacterium]